MSAETVWTPHAAADSRMARFIVAANENRGLELDPTDYAAAWRWSVAEGEAFWEEIWRFFEVIGHTSYSQVMARPGMPASGWFTGATLNYAEHALRVGADDAVAIIVCSEDREDRSITWRELRDDVGSLAAWLRAQGVRPGDRVAAYLPNGPHAVVGFLACAAVGAIWSLCGPDYGVPGALSRFQQLEPVVLLAADGYRWNGRLHDRRAHVEQLRAGLPSVRAVVAVDDLELDAADRDLGVSSPPAWAEATSWSSVVARPAPLVFDPVPAEAPLWVLFSSGTSGAPKGIVHSHVGVLLEHLKQVGLHFDLSEGDRFFWFTSTNWMMWNLQVSALLVGATVITYDGSPTHGTPDALWQLAARTRATVFGTSPGYLVACANSGVHPASGNDLSALKILGVTGSPMSAASYTWVYEELDPRVQVSSAAGGTDVATAFAAANPLTPVWAGELSAPALGVALESWSPQGTPMTGEVGELVVTTAMPSMPLFFWNDPTGERYRDAYFGVYPGVWRHGDWVIVTDRGSVVFTGRSDATLNRNGVRFGSADIYAAIENIESLTDQIVVGVDLTDGGYWMPLFVQLAEGAELDDALRHRIRTAISTHASPRHVPDDIIAVPGVPHTRTGKRLEIPVKRLIQGARLADVVDRDAVDQPELLDFYAAVRAPQRVGD